MTFEELRIRKSEDFTDLEEGKRVSWSVEYCGIRKEVKDPKGTTIISMKETIERSREFLEALKKTKEKNPCCYVKLSIIIKRTETQLSRLCVFSLLQPHRTEVRLTGKYRYLTFEDRKKIEAWHLLGDRPVDIAARLSVHHTTIYKELQRGATGALDANQREGYSAELAERRLRESFKRRGKRAPAAQ